MTSSTRKPRPAATAKKGVDVFDALPLHFQIYDNINKCVVAELKDIDEGAKSFEIKAPIDKYSWKLLSKCIQKCLDQMEYDL